MAPIEMTRVTIARDSVIGSVGTEEVAKRDGVYQGRNTEPVTNSTKSNVLSLAKHDNLAHALHTNFKTLSQRSVRQGQAASMDATAKIANFYDKIVDQLPNMPAPEVINHLVHVLEELSDHAKAREQEGQGAAQSDSENAETRGDQEASLRGDVLAALQEFDGDVSHQFAALEFARDYFAAEDANAEFMNALDQAKTEFERSDVARDVRAGFAIAELADQASATLATDPASVRNAYRSMLRDKRNIGELFDSISTFDMTKQFEEVVDIFMTAAGQDLASTGPSTDKTFLHGLLTELGKLKKMRSVYESGKDVIDKTNRILSPPKRSGRGSEPEGEKIPTNATQLTSRVLNFCAKSAVNPADTRLLLGGLDRVSPAGRVVFANLLKDLHLEVPDDAMPSPQARLQQSRELEKLLNQLVAAEEASYESGALAR
jgi:type III secretion system YopN/LcrE/InvE/MxiC family regulator